jgi:uncharacterized protein YjiS (DUF1127 family)
MQMLHNSIVEQSIVQPQHWLMFLSTRTKTQSRKTSKTMTYFNDTHTNGSFIERMMASAGHMLEAAALRRAQRRVYRKTLDELSALSNRDLADLGLARSELRRIAWEAGQQHTAA